jgi:hypothetical protein
MPYFVFRPGALGLPEKVAEAPSYREAKALLAEFRRRPDVADPAAVRMIFAANEIEAADLLTQPRAPDPAMGGDDD